MTDLRKPLFVIPHDLGAMAAGDVATGYAVENLNRHKAIGLTWRTASDTSIWARGDMSTAKAIDFCSIVSANAQAGTTIRLRLGDSQAEVDGTADYDSGAVALINPSITRADGLYHSHLELPSLQTKRWWRIDIGGHTGPFEASHLVLGERIQPSRFYNLDFEYGVKDLGGMEWTRFGVPNEDEGVVFRSITFTLAWITEAEFEADFRPMMEALGKRGVVYCCFDPEATIYRQARTYMGVFGKLPFARGVRKPRTFSMDFQIDSFI